MHAMHNMNHIIDDLLQISLSCKHVLQLNNLNYEILSVSFGMTSESYFKLISLLLSFII